MSVEVFACTLPWLICVKNKYILQICATSFGIGCENSVSYTPTRKMDDVIISGYAHITIIDVEVKSVV